MIKLELSELAIQEVLRCKFFSQTDAF
jgi:hypothetical protein